MKAHKRTAIEANHVRQGPIITMQPHMIPRSAAPRDYEALSREAEACAHTAIHLCMRDEFGAVAMHRPRTCETQNMAIAANSSSSQASSSSSWSSQRALFLARSENSSECAWKPSEALCMVATQSSLFHLRLRIHEANWTRPGLDIYSARLDVYLNLV